MVKGSYWDRVRDTGNVGNEIALARRGKELKQEQLADEIGVSTALVARWEINDVPLTRVNAERVARALDIDSDKLVLCSFIDRLVGDLEKRSKKFKREYAGVDDVQEIISWIDELAERLAERKRRVCSGKFSDYK